MRIAIIAPTAIPGRTANTFQVMKMTQAIASLGHNVRLYAPRLEQQQNRSDDEQTSWDGLARHYGLASQPQFQIEWLPAGLHWRRYDFAWRALSAARKSGMDLLYTRLPQAAALGSQMGIPTILEVHDLPQGRTGPWLFQLFLSGRGAARLTIITHALADDLRQKFKSQAFEHPAFIIVAADGIDLTRFQDLPQPAEARRRLQISSPGRFTAGYTGHFYSGRGIDLILKMAGRLSHINFLLVGGEPADFDCYTGQVKTLGLENVILPGFVPNADLPIYQAACNVLLMPYQQHVAASSGGDIGRYLSPMKLFEYMACCRPIFSSDLPVLREVLNPENARLLPPADLDAWVAAIEELSRNPHIGESLADQACKDVLRYTWKARAQSILKDLAPTGNQFPDRKT